MPSSQSSRRLIPDHYLPDLPLTQRCRCELPSSSTISAADRTNLHDDSAFFRALLEHYTPTRLDKKDRQDSSSDLERELADGMIDYHEDHKKLARMARHTQDEIRRLVVKQPRPDLIGNLSLYQPKGQWAWIREVPLDESEDEIFVSRNKGRDSYKLRIKTARASDVRITYLSKLLIEGPEKWTGFWAEAALFKTLLQPFHNHLVPAMIGIYNTYRGIQFAFDLPHHSFWIQASPDMPDILKRRCIETYRQLHEQGVLHGSVDLANILIGGDGSVKLINFHQARATLAMPYVHLKQAAPEEFALEMREILYKLDYDNARSKEEQNWRGRRRRRSKGRGKGKGKTKAKEMLSGLEDPFRVPLHPPIDPGPEGLNWVVPEDWTPKRFVVPGQTLKQFHAHVKLFLSSLQGEGFEEAAISESASSPSHSTTPDRASTPSHPVTAEEPTRKHYNLRKRPRESLSDADLPSAKRQKIVDFFPLVTSRDGSLYALKPPPKGPYNPRTFWRGKRRRVKEEPQEMDLNSLDTSTPSLDGSNPAPKNASNPSSSTTASPRVSSARASSIRTSRSQSRCSNEPIPRRNVQELQVKLYSFLNRLPSQKQWRKRNASLNEDDATVSRHSSIGNRSSGDTDVNTNVCVNPTTTRSHKRTGLRSLRKRRRGEESDYSEAASEDEETRPSKRLRRSETLVLISGPAPPSSRKGMQVLAEGEKEQVMDDEIFILRPSSPSEAEAESESSSQAERTPFSSRLLDCTDEELETYLDDAIHGETDAVEYDFDMGDAEDFLFRLVPDGAAMTSEVFSERQDNLREQENDPRQEDEPREHGGIDCDLENLYRNNFRADADVHVQNDDRHGSDNNHVQESKHIVEYIVCKEEETDIRLEWDNKPEESRVGYNDALDVHDCEADDTDYLVEYGIDPVDDEGLPMTSVQKFFAIINAMQERRAEERRVERELLAPEPRASTFPTIGSRILNRISDVSNTFRNLLPSSQV